MSKLSASIAHAGINAGAAVIARMVRVQDIQDNQDIASIFAIQDETLQAIISSIKEKGYDKAQPVVLWKGQNFIVDGRTRLKAAIAAGLKEIPAEEKEFNTLEEAKFYAYKRQAERRNLTQAEILAAACELKIRYAHDGTGRGSEILAKELGVSPSTIQRARAVTAAAEPEIIEQVKNNKMSINKAYRLTKEMKNNEKARAENAGNISVKIKIHQDNKNIGSRDYSTKKVFQEILSFLRNFEEKGSISKELYEDIVSLLMPLVGNIFFDDTMDNLPIKSEIMVIEGEIIE
jgi:ParB-like chromosome segregation protein Spo0J